MITKIVKYLTIACLLTLLLFSCMSEECPVPYCTMEVTFVAEGETFPIDKADAFLRKEITGQVFGPIKIEEFTDIHSEPLVGNNKKFTAKSSVILPYGQYTMWVWANVGKQEVYMRPHYSVINMLDNYVGDNYMLGKTQRVSIGSRKQSMQFDILPLTAKVSVSTSNPIYKGISLIVNDVYTRVNADGVYSQTNNPRVFDYGDAEDGLTPDVPPAIFYTFPTVGAGDSRLNLSYQNITNITEISPLNQRFDAANSVNIQFLTNP